MPLLSVWRHGSGVTVVKTAGAWFLKPYTRLAAASNLLYPEESNATWFQKPKHERLTLQSGRRIGGATRRGVGLSVCPCASNGRPHLRRAFGGGLA